jgi:hypothetical protein
LWVYHGPYDFVLLVIPILHACRRILSARRVANSEWRAAIAELLCFVVIGAGLARPVYTGDDGVFRAARWGCRLALIGLLAWYAIRLRHGRPVVAQAPPESSVEGTGNRQAAIG